MWLHAPKSRVPSPCSSPLIPLYTCNTKKPHFTLLQFPYVVVCYFCTAAWVPVHRATHMPIVPIFPCLLKRLEQQHLVELLHAARSVVFYIKHTHFCKNSIIVWQNSERFSFASPGYLFIPLVRLCLYRKHVCGRMGREVQFVLIGFQVSARTY